MTVKPASRDRSSSPVLNLIQVLRCFTVETPELSVTSIAEQVGVHKSTVSRLLATLEVEQMVERDPESRKYRLGLGLIGIAGPLLASLDVRRLAYPVLNELSEASGETTALTVWDGSAAVTVEQIAGSQRIKHTSPMGTRYTTMHSASVMVLLAQQPADTATQLCRSGALVGYQGQRLDERTSSDIIEDFEQELAEVRDRGTAMNYGRTYDDEVGVSALVVDHRERPVAAVLVAAPAYRVSKDRAEELLHLCQRAADQISSRMGLA